MDPDATLKELIDSLIHRDWERADELQDALRSWLERRGAPPLTVGPKELGPAWHRTVAAIIRRLAASKVRAAINARERWRGD